MQNWNNILSFIKTKLGSKITLLELSDEDIINELKEHALFEFSQYCSLKKRITITSENKIISNIGEQSNVYKIPINDNEPIIDVFDVVINDSLSVYNDYTNDVLTSIQQYESISDIGYINNDMYYGIQDAVIANKIFDIATSLRPRNTWDFIPPDTITFDSHINGAVVIYNTVHNNLSTISPDMYHIFKRLCLGYIQETLVSLRSKFETINTPFGEIRINWQKLQEDSNNNLQYAREKLETYPSDHVLTIDV